MAAITNLELSNKDNKAVKKKIQNNTIGHCGTTLYFAEKILLQFHQSIKIH